VKRILKLAVHCLKAAIRFSSVHAASLQPRRMVAWLEAAVRVPVEECTLLLKLVPDVLSRRPDPDDETPAEAVGLVSVAQWEEGARQLRQEVSHRVLRDCDCDGDRDCDCCWEWDWPG
jgi:hypothetical protein